MGTDALRAGRQVVVPDGVSPGEAASCWMC
jgi:hypothetical protein